MNRLIFNYALALWIVLVLSGAATASDTLRRDSLMLTTGVEVMFKAGTPYRTNSRGLVVEGTPARDVDMWTTGPLILFSHLGAIRLNHDGRVTSGVLGNNTLINCADNVFREFARDNRIAFNDAGLLVRGTPVGAIPFMVNGTAFLSQPGMPIGFYPSGNIHLVHPQGNFRIYAPDGTRIMVSGSSWIEVSEDGHFMRGAILKKVTCHNRDGVLVVLMPGDIIRMDAAGNVLN